MSERREDPKGLRWEKVAGPDDLGEGRVRPVTCHHRTVCLTRFEGEIAALDNRCPHQGGPLGEGSIENGWLRCPWHGWDFHPLTGKPPGGFDDGVETFPVECREDGVYVGFPAERERGRTVSDLMVETMKEWGVRWVFGMVGHSNLGLADAVRRLDETGEVRFIGVRHEGAASFACSAYGKLTGWPAACLSIAGPGATNMLTGLWDANVDRAPVLALTGQVQTQVLGPGAFQEVNLQAAYGKVAVWSQTVLEQSRHAELMTLAVKHARVGRGVAHLIFPDQVQNLPAGDAASGGPRGRIAERTIAPPATELERALGLLRTAQRPVVIVGHGARFHMNEVVELAERLNAPVITTFKGKGLIPDRHPLACGVLGRSGTPIASWFMNESDVLLVLGASFSNHTGITPKKPTIQVDLDPMALGRFHAVEVPLWGEIGVTARAMTAGLNDATGIDRREEIAARWAIWRREKARREAEDRGKGVGSARIFAALARALPEDAVIAVDVGNNTYSFGRYFECERQAILMSGYLGSIGFAFPAAMGAWAAVSEPESPFVGRAVVSVSGDGGFAQYMAELTTAVHNQMNITHVLLTNGELGKISKEQRAGGWDVFKTALSNPDFAAYARSCGAFGIRVNEPGQLDAALAAALDHNGPALVEIVADPLLI